MGQDWVPAFRSVFLPAEVAKFAKSQLHSKAGGVSGLAERVRPELGLVVRKRTGDSVSGFAFLCVLPLSYLDLPGSPHPKTTSLKTRVRHGVGVGVTPARASLLGLGLYFSGAGGCRGHD